MKGTVIVIASVLITIAHLLHAGPNLKTSRTDQIGQGISAAVYVYPSPGTRTSPDKAIKSAFDEARHLYRDLESQSSGEVGELNKNAGQGPTRVSSSLLLLLAVCNQISDWTQGLFNIVKGGSGKKGAGLWLDLRKGEVALPEKKSYVDLYGVRNGYVIDRMAGILRGQGFKNIMIQSGDITRTMGKDGASYWRLNVPDPRGGKMLCRVSLETSSVATADIRDLRGAAARLGKEPKAPTDLQSVTVLAKNATSATALATTGLLVGKARARSMFQHISEAGFGAILKDQNGKIETIGDVPAACFE